MSSGTLFSVATPIGNLNDLTFRALEVLKKADRIACEDTRRTLQLLRHFGIEKPLVTIFGPKEKRETPAILRLLEEGKSVALVTDAGTPGLSDPGNFLVRSARERGFRIEPVPGASAVAAIVSASGVCEDGFIFLGFLPRKKSKIKRQLAQALSAERAVIFYESPFRVVETLEIAREIFGPECFCLIGREMTKKFEEFIAGPLGDAPEKLKQKEILGEFTVLIKP